MKSKILVVDDCCDTCLMICTTLGLENFDVDIADITAIITSRTIRLFEFQL